MTIRPHFLRYSWKQWQELPTVVAFSQVGGVVGELLNLHLRQGDPIYAAVDTVVIEPVATEPLRPIPASPADGRIIDYEHREVLAGPEILAQPVGYPRRRWVFEAITTAVGELCRARDWAQEPLDAAAQACLDDELELDWAGQPRTSPDRRIRATPHCTIDDEGQGWLSLHLTERSSGRPVVRTSPISILPTLEAFALAARSLRWGSADQLTVHLPGPWEETVKINLDASTDDTP